MVNQPNFDDREWQFILEVLEAERREERTVRHHTDGLEAKQEMDERLRTLDGIVERVKNCVGHA